MIELTVAADQYHLLRKSKRLETERKGPRTGCGIKAGDVRRIRYTLTDEETGERSTHGGIVATCTFAKRIEDDRWQVVYEVKALVEAPRLMRRGGGETADPSQAVDDGGELVPSSFQAKLSKQAEQENARLRAERMAEAREAVSNVRSLQLSRDAKRRLRRIEYDLQLIEREVGESAA